MVVLICIFITISDVEPLFISYACGPFVYSLWRNVFSSSLTIFKIGLFVFPR